MSRPDDVEDAARAFERAARHHIHAAALETDEAFRLKRAMECTDRRWAQDMGAAYGFLFRSRELRYDARGGMTEEFARRRFEPGARWAHRAGAQASALLCSIRWVSADDSYLCMAPGPNGRDTFLPRRAELTRANGWLFLDIGQGAEPGRRP